MTSASTDRIFEARAENQHGSLFSLGVRHSVAEAEAILGEASERHGNSYARYWVEEIDTTGLFQIPPRPAPRDRYTTRVRTTTAPGRWAMSHVEVLDGETVVAEYNRNYDMLQTFEPFRQGDPMFALVSSHYTATSVLDLQTGEVVASEEPYGLGFCPVGFYVPDWWDVHDGKKLPGTLRWNAADDEWPVAGDFGFVWGCVWGDDASWKVQYLDLSSIDEGVIRREERFGYLRLDSDPKLPASDFIRCSSWQGQHRVEIRTSVGFDLATGTAIPHEEL